jgi:capsular exopolysaccharide synthesis family protein
MSRLYEALKRLESNGREPGDFAAEFVQPAEILNSAMEMQAEIEGAHAAKLNVSPKSRLVALSAPRSLGAEKFRALVTRLETIRHQRELKSLQITSSVGSEGKSLVAANLTLTLASYHKSRVLLIEGDLHRPTLASLFGLNPVKGLSDWWSGTDQDFTGYLYQLNDMPLWFLGAGKAHDQPSDILQSSRFTETLTSVARQFDWIVVDSTPMLPIVDANLWSRLVDGTLLVVREGVATINALKKGLESLDNPKLLGVVLNEASEFDQGNYAYSYYGSK